VTLHFGQIRCFAVSVILDFSTAPPLPAVLISSAVPVSAWH
jgi:hypothetical protein